MSEIVFSEDVEENNREDATLFQQDIHTPLHIPRIITDKDIIDIHTHNIEPTRHRRPTNGLFGAVLAIFVILIGCFIIFSVATQLGETVSDSSFTKNITLSQEMEKTINVTFSFLPLVVLAGVAFAVIMSIGITR